MLASAGNPPSTVGDESVARSGGGANGRKAPLFALFTLVAVGLVAGLAMSFQAFREPRGVTAAPVAAARDYAFAEAITTSFGSVVVDTADLLPGLTPDQLGMTMTHGIQSLIGPDQVQIQASVIFSNQRGRAAAYAPDMFVLRSSSREAAILPASASVRDGLLQAGTSISASLSFVAPRDGSSYWIEFREPGQTRSARVFVGASDLGPPDHAADRTGGTTSANSEGIADQP